MKTIYLVRHGEATNNIGLLYEGGNSPLTEKGVEQAKFIAERAARLPVEVLIASPMRRTRETAEYISKRINKPIEFCELFEERHIPTSIDGREQTDKDATKIFEEWRASFATDNARALDGENFEDIKERAKNALSFLENRREENILVVGHGFFSKTLLARILFGESLTPAILGEFEWGMMSKNTGLSVLKYDPDNKHRDWCIWVWDDHTHLG